MSTPTKPALSEKETTLLALSWQCFKNGAPEIDMVKLSDLAGYTNTGSCRNAMAAIRKKLEIFAPSAPSTPTSSSKLGKAGKTGTPRSGAKGKEKSATSTPTGGEKKQKVTPVEGGKLGFAEAAKGGGSKRKAGGTSPEEDDGAGIAKKKTKRTPKKEIELDSGEDDSDGAFVDKTSPPPKGERADGESKPAIKTEPDTYGSDDDSDEDSDEEVAV